MKPPLAIFKPVAGSPEKPAFRSSDGAAFHPLHCWLAVSPLGGFPRDLPHAAEGLDSIQFVIMTEQNYNPGIREARAIVLQWVEGSLVEAGQYTSDDELSRAFVAHLPADVDLELRCSWNPSALVFEARWYQRGRQVEDFPKPFCAETEGDARLLACAAMINLPD